MSGPERKADEYAANFRAEVTVCAGCTFPEVLPDATYCPDCELPVRRITVVNAERLWEATEPTREER